MPHVDIKCYPGRTEEQKKLCAEKVANVISEIMGCDVSHISIAINEVEKADWASNIWDKEIAPNMDKLYVKPGYKPENR